jgi:hypothetical protein
LAACLPSRARYRCEFSVAMTASAVSIAVLPFVPG